MMSDYCTGVTPLTRSFAAFLDSEQLNPINVNILNKVNISLIFYVLYQNCNLALILLLLLFLIMLTTISY